METDAQTALRAAERGAAAPFVDYPPTPWWVFPATGLWVGAMVAAVGLIAGEDPLGIVLLVGLVALEVAGLRWYRAYRGTQPRLVGGPPELKPVMRAYLAGCVATLALVAALFALAGPVVAAVAAAALVTVELAVYERTYGAAAESARARLA